MTKGKIAGYLAQNIVKIGYKTAFIIVLCTQP